MTTSGRWLEARRAGLERREAVAGLLVAVGVILVALAAGVALARLGLYRAQPVSVIGGWAVVVAAGGLGIWRARRRRRADARAVAALVEQGGGLRRGSVAGVALEQRTGSASLAALADARVAQWLEDHGEGALRDARRERRKALGWSAAIALCGVGLFVASGPGARAGSDFWRPLSALARVAGPVTVSVDRSDVRRGERVTVSVKAPGHRGAVLWVRAPGEPWRSTPLALDTAGHATQVLGPLDSDRFVRATAGAKESATLRVRVSLPALLADLELIATYPPYLDLADEPLVPGPDPVLLPVGTQIDTRGRTTLPLRSATWRREGAGTPLVPPQRDSPSARGRRADRADQSQHVGTALAVAGTAFQGRLAVRASGRFTLVVSPEGGVPLEGEPPELNLVAVPDSIPVISVPVPGGDTTAPLSLRQPLVIDVRDDHRVTRVEMVSRRVSRLGLVTPPQTDTLALPEGGAERVVLSWTLDLNGRGFWPGDTAFYRVRALDNAPAAHLAESREYRLRLPSNAELREALREASRAVAAAADSLAREQRGLAQATEELSAERERASEGAQAPFRGGMGQARPGAQGDLPFRSAQRAGELADQQARVMERAAQMQEELKLLAEAASNAGLTDPQWQAELKELERLLDRAVTPELEQRLNALREALQKLDPEALREALKRLAEAGKEFRDQLSRSRELFERAALEGEMTTLAEDAEELAQRQRDWNRQAEAAALDSALAQAERALATETDSLAARMSQLDQELRKQGQPEGTAAEQQRASQAARAMDRAAGQAQTGERQQAQRSGQEAEQALDPVAQRLRQQRDALRDQWRRDVIQTLDYALAETADLARRQVDLAQRMRGGDASADARNAQAALRESADRVMQRLQTAAGKNALVSPQVGTSLGFARLRMAEAVDRLQRATPNPSEAGELAGQAVDGLNAMTQALLRSRAEVQGAESGSGLQEAVEKMAQLAAQQQALNGESGGMLPLMALGGEGLLQDLRALAERQRRLAAELERMNAEGQAEGAEELAQEARDLARRLEAGQLDRRTIERQERLFRRLLDQGRTLRGDEQDEEKERTSQTARPDNVRLPPALRPGAAGKGPKYPYPTWEQLRQLSPEERRLILDYFRRLNEGRP
ncbi:MAG: hypothetical protein HYV20_02275 [Gemmatimonadetes bacterium]|nr:hypothetical protein [Gemmatimonadota bacterium]